MRCSRFVVLSGLISILISVCFPVLLGGLGLALNALECCWPAVASLWLVSVRFWQASSPNVYFCSVWEGLIRAYHYCCSVFISIFSSFWLKYTNMWDFLQNYLKMVHGFFVMVSCYILYVIFHFWGSAVPPPTKGTQTNIFSRNLRLGSEYGFFLELTAGTQHSGSRK